MSSPKGILSLLILYVSQRAMSSPDKIETRKVMRDIEELIHALKTSTFSLSRSTYYPLTNHFLLSVPATRYARTLGLMLERARQRKVLPARSHPNGPADPSEQYSVDHQPLVQMDGLPMAAPGLTDMSNGEHQVGEGQQEQVQVLSPEDDSTTPQQLMHHPHPHSQQIAAQSQQIHHHQEYSSDSGMHPAEQQQQIIMLHQQQTVIAQHHLQHPHQNQNQNHQLHHHQQQQQQQQLQTHPHPLASHAHHQPHPHAMPISGVAPPHFNVSQSPSSSFAPVLPASELIVAQHQHQQHHQQQHAGILHGQPGVSYESGE